MDLYPPRRKLIEVGAEHGEGYPWHKTKDTFLILLAEYLLCRTTRRVVERVFLDVTAEYADAKALSCADPEDIWEIARDAGLKARTTSIIGLARAVVEQGGVSAEREWLMGLPYVGEYVSDAVLLYGFGRRVFPLDRNVQRVLHRVALGTPPPPARISPYRDGQLADILQGLLHRLPTRSVRALHQGVLWVAWVGCRFRPACSACPISRCCVGALGSVVAEVT